MIELARFALGLVEVAGIAVIVVMFYGLIAGWWA